jgi:hypothetical protein
MKNFLFVGDKREVLGVWMVDDRNVAKKLHLKLQLMYPNCQTVVDQSTDYESLKEGYSEFEFGNLEPDLSPAF